MRRWFTSWVICIAGTLALRTLSGGRIDAVWLMRNESSRQSRCATLFAAASVSMTLRTSTLRVLKDGRSVPPISLDTVIKAATVVEQMGKVYLPLRKLIEVALPLEAINKAAAREKFVSHQAPNNERQSERMSYRLRLSS